MIFEKTGRERATVTEDGEIVWWCDVCHKPVSDDTGYVTMRHAEQEKVNEWHNELDRKMREMAEENGETLACLNSEDLETCPEVARWHVLHRDCDPLPDSYDYWIAVDRIRTHSEVHGWSSHLLGKRWIQNTDWRDLLRDIAKED